MAEERRVPLEGCVNFRDLGGYAARDGWRVRTGRLYRSDGLHELTPNDIEHLRERVQLSAIVDLRTPHEAETEGPGALAEAPVRYYHVSLMQPSAGEPRALQPGEPFEMDRFYVAMLREGREQVRTIVDLLAHAGGPTVFHCAAGKDRTGVIAALVLSLLGVDDAQIVDDYAATRSAIDRIRSRLKRSRGYEKMWKELPPETLHAHPETMHGMLERVREEWGSMRDYAADAGVEERTIEKLRRDLLIGA
jgi:protein-tyrosine phosphatase